MSSVSPQEADSATTPEANEPNLAHRISDFLCSGLIEAVEAPAAYASPARILFVYSALLISALNHVGRGQFRTFLDLRLTDNGKSVRWCTTLPDMDRRLREPLVIASTMNSETIPNPPPR